MAKLGKHNEGHKRHRANGEGSIYWFESKKCWVAAITVGINPKTGNPKRNILYGKTQKEVQGKLDELKVKLFQGININKDNITVSEWLAHWMVTYQTPILRDTTYPSYEDEIRLHISPNIGNIKLRSLQTDDLQLLINKLWKDGRIKKSKDLPNGLAVSHLRYIRAILHKALKQAVTNRMLIYNPVDGVTLPKAEKKEVVPFTEKESEKFLVSIIKHRMFAIYFLGFMTGLRRGELLGLMWDDIDFDAEYFEIKRELVAIKNRLTGKRELKFGPPKSERSLRILPLTEKIVKVLKTHKARQNKERLFFGTGYEDNGLVFCSEDGKKLWPRNFNRQYTQLLEKAGLTHKKPHAMRHTFATLQIEKGTDLKQVQELLGHAVLAMTADTYKHVVEHSRAKQKAINRMDDTFDVDVDEFNADEPFKGRKKAQS